MIPSRTRAGARIAGIAAGLALLSVSAASASGAGEHGRVAQLQQQSSVLASHAHSVLLDLYALDSQLADARSRLSALELDSARLQNEQLRLQLQLAATRRTLSSSQASLAQNLRMLYVQNENSNALAVVLGATSLDAAVTRIDDLTRVADQSRQIVAATTAATRRLAHLRSTLSSRRAELAARLSDAQRTTERLGATRDARARFLAGLRNAQQLKSSQIRALEADAQRARAKAQELQAAAATRSSNPLASDPATTTSTAPAPAPAPTSAPASGRTLTVSSTGYSLPGHTASGLPVGWGIVAVDPSVIPLGTRMFVPGYGEAVAADVGSAVRGLDIDIWFPTLAQARAWGRRTITITLH